MKPPNTWAAEPDREDMVVSRRAPEVMHEESMKNIVVHNCQKGPMSLSEAIEGTDIRQSTA